MKSQVSLETTIEHHDLGYYLGLEPALHGRKADVLPLDHRCLLNLSWTVMAKHHRQETAKIKLKFSILFQMNRSNHYIYTVR